MPKNVAGIMKEWQAGTLHSGSATGPVVKNQKQAVAIALSEKAKAAGGMPMMPKPPQSKQTKMLQAKRREGVPGLTATRNNLKFLRTSTLPKGFK